MPFFHKSEIILSKQSLLNIYFVLVLSVGCLETCVNCVTNCVTAKIYPKILEIIFFLLNLRTGDAPFQESETIL